MNPVVEEMLAVYNGEIDHEEAAELMHYGMPRRSGRYPWGSGDDPYQRTGDFISRVNEYKKQGKTETEIADIMGIYNSKGAPSVSKLRSQYSIATNERKLYQIATAKSLAEDGLGATEIGRRMGVRESTVRSWLNPKVEENSSKARNTADIIKKAIDEKGMIDVGAGVEIELGVTATKLNEALTILQNEGYPLHGGRVDQLNNPGQKTTLKVICPPGTPHRDIFNYDQVHSLSEYTSRDGGETFTKFQYPASLDSKRLKIRYAEDGGTLKDGIVELRRGVEDLSLGDARYSQVRILVDDKKYIKGVAVYSDDMPDGVDVIFNTNKSNALSKLDVLKDSKRNADGTPAENPFGSLIKANGQSEYTDAKGEKKLSLINKRADEGDWSDWQDTLPSQFLGKQSKTMAQKQLDLAKADKLAEFDEICSINNPTIKKHMLQKFSDECDAAAVHLKAAALPGQKYHVIIPVNTLKENEIYAPNYEPGTKLALVRYPHAGTFEIPILTVNNKHQPARDIIGPDSRDAVGINKKVADRLSGADFDGDTVMCIPTHDKNGRVRITSTRELKGLIGFEPKEAYPERAGMRYMKDPVTDKDSTQMEMGKISNLITDMTLAGAPEDKLARAVRHSMVVIDAAKHKLDYKKSEADNNISALVKEYQQKVMPDGTVKTGGASTILSRASGEATVDRRQGTPKVNIPGKDWYDPSRPDGALIYKTADDVEYTVTKVNKRTGAITTKTKHKTQASTQMAEVDDAYKLVSAHKHPMEMIYADYANSMKALGNKARLEMHSTGKLEYSKSAKSVYQAEYDSLMSKLNKAEMNKPKERAALRLANAKVQAEKASNPTLSKSDIKKLNAQAVSKYRDEVGAVSRKDRNIQITDREWEAIQAGAISESKLKRILNNADIDVLRERATPRSTTTLSTAKVNRIKAMRSSNYTLNQIADALGISTSMVSRYLKGDD